MHFSGMGLVTTRPDGLSSATVGYAEVGELVTMPVNLSDTSAAGGAVRQLQRLQLNVDCGGSGTLHVELLAPGSATALPCYSLAEATPIWTNDLRAIAHWGNSESAACAAARAGMIEGVRLVQVRFVLEACDLFSMQFV